MKSCHVLVSLAVVGLLLSGCDDTDDGFHANNNVSNTDHYAREPFHYAVDVDEQTRLELRGINGNIGFRTAHQPDTLVPPGIEVDGERRVGSDSDADAERHLQYLSVEMDVGDDIIRVWTEQPEQTQGREYVVDYEITIAHTVMLNSLGVDHVNGNITFEEATWPGYPELIEINHVNGNVEIGLYVGNVDVNLVNGQLGLSGVFGSVTGRVTNGTISCVVHLPEAGWCHLSGVNGVLDLSVPTTTSAEFSATVVTGGIYLTGLTLTDPISTPTSLTGTLLDGDGDIRLDIVNGNISVAAIGAR